MKTAANKRFGVSRGICSRKVLQEFESLSPVRAFAFPHPNAQQTVWRHAGCLLAESFAGICKFVARPSFCVPPPERQAANRWAQLNRQLVSTNFKQKKCKKT